jgi:L-threonylcarbamoyladenylate synthase
MSQSINAEVVPPTESNLRLAADLVRGGGVIVTPSDTNLALTMDPWNSAAIRRAFAIKRRPATSPLTLFLCHPGDWARYTTVPEHLRAVIDDLVDAFWPGPFNIVLPRNELVSDDLVCGGPTVALGCLSNPTACWSTWTSRWRRSGRRWT